MRLVPRRLLSAAADDSDAARGALKGVIRSRYTDSVYGALLSDMQSYIGFGERDIAHLRELAHLIRPQIPRVVARFYAEIARHPSARAVFVGGDEQIARQKTLLAAWLDSLFCGQYDAAYAEQRARIGHTHVRVGLPQHFMFTAMEVIWQECQSIVHAAAPPEMAAQLAALHKLLTLDTGMMLESYKESSAQRVRALEQQGISERLARSEHLAAIGQLAASLAHELKNPLAGISGAIQVIRDELHDGDAHRPVLDEVLRQINRLDNTVKDLLTYARPMPPVFGPCDLRPILGRVTALLRREPALRRLRLDVAADGDLKLEADEHQIEQVLINLLLNAAQASKPGAAIRLGAAGEDAQLVVRVEDDGQGMDAQTLRRAREPFYTTKSRGTGLGLPICARIIAAHGGTLHMESEPGHGTRVVLHLPRRVQPAGAGP